MEIKIMFETKYPVFILYLITFQAINCHCRQIFESQTKPNAFIIQRKHKERKALTEAGRLSAPWMGLVYLFRTLLPERRIE